MLGDSDQTASRTLSTAALLCGLALTAGCHQGCASSPDVVQWRFDDSDIDESSGLAASRRHPDIFWTHNDSGGEPVLYATTATGKVVARTRVAGVENKDWEDVAIDDAGNLYIGDMGNNRNNRDDLAVYVIAEPDPALPSTTSHVDRVIRFHYAEQRDAADPPDNFDAESLFWTQGRLYLLTKHRDDTRTVLYRFPVETGDESVALEKVGEFDLGGDPDEYGGMATGADVTVDGERLVVLSYHAIFVFERPGDSDNYLRRLTKRIELDNDVTGQVEAVAWDGDAILFSNEDGELHRIADWRERGRYPGR